MFISLESCDLIMEKCDEFLSFILHALFYAVILIYFSLNVVLSLNLIFFSYFFNYLDIFFDHKVLTLLSFYTFSFAIFNNSPYSTYVNNFCIVSFEVIRLLRRLRKGHITYSPYYISACNFLIIKYWLYYRFTHFHSQYLIIVHIVHM